MLLITKDVRQEEIKSTKSWTVDKIYDLVERILSDKLC